MSGPPGSSSKRRIYLDPKHCYALLHLLAEEKIIEESAPVAFNQISTVGDLIVHRNPSTFHVTARDKKETLLLLSMYEEIHLHVPKGLFTMFDLSQLGAEVIPYTVLHDSEGKTWRDLELLRAKGTLLGQLRIIEDNPRARLPRDPLPFDKMFSGDDLQDFDALRSLIMASLGDVWLEAHYYLPQKHDLGRAFQDPEFISHVCRDTAKRTGGGQNQVWALFLSLALGIRDALADVRSLLAYGSDTMSAISWPSATQPPQIDSTCRARSEEWIVVRALLKELDQLPQPTSIEQARRYRESGRVRALWNRIEQWKAALCVGDLYGERNVRESIASTVEQLSHAERSSRIAGLATCLSLPLAVVEVLIGLPPVASLTIGAIGGAYDASSRLARWKNRWFMWN